MTKMFIRRKILRILPRTFRDISSMAFILFIVPLLYWFELWIVLPALYKDATLAYFVHFTIGNFIMLNIIGNFTYAVLCDTSTKRDIIPVSVANTEEGWRLCATCETLAPPRSWHCPTCDVCILKRDHHCIFTGCCVGHYNHRYFMMFLFYLFVATTYSFYFNNFFIWSRLHFSFPTSVLKIIFPMAIFLFGIDGSDEQLYLMLYVVTVVGMLYTAILCIYHFRLIFYGCVANESNKENYAYNLGWKQNVKEVFGEKWYITWLVPYINSPLPHNGIVWDTSNSWYSKNSKTK